MSLFTELKRRNVFKVGAAYLVVGWVVIEVASLLAPQLSLPEWAPRMITFVVLLGFPIALVIAWIFDLTPEGVQVTAGKTGSKRFYATVAVIAAAMLGWFYYQGQGDEPESVEVAAASPDAGAPRSLAVLPFAVLSQDPDTVGLAGGLHDTLITQLSRLHGLEVRSRTSVMRYQDWTGGLPVIAEELGVSVILEGTVQRLGNRTVVNAQLIDARADSHLWAETFDLTNDDLFALQADIAQRVAAALQIALTADERAVLTTAPTNDQEAYALYTQGVRLLYTADGTSAAAERRDAYLRAMDVLEAAVERDPQFALAWAMLARANATLAWGTFDSDYREASQNARRAADEAVALGGRLAEARYASGIVALQLDFDFERAEREFRAAIEGMPSSAEMYSRLAVASVFLNRWHEGLAASRRAVELEPTNSGFMRQLFEILYSQQAWDEMRALSRRVAVLNPGNYVAARLQPDLESLVAGDLAPLAAFVRSAGAGYRANSSLTDDRVTLAVAAGNWEEAVAILDSVESNAQPDPAGFVRAWVLVGAGREAEAQAALASARDWFQVQLQSDRDPYIEAMMRSSLAWLQVHLGDEAAARENIALADRLWGLQREPADAGRVAVNIARVHVALDDYDAAVAQLRPLAERPSYWPAQRLWMVRELAPLHRHEPFLALMRANGVDVTRSPFAAMLAAGED